MFSKVFILKFTRVRSTKIIKDFDFFFCILTNKFILKNNFVLNKFILSNKLLFKVLNIKINKVNKLISYKFDFWAIPNNLLSLKKKILSLNYYSNNPFSYKLNLIGLGYRIMRITFNLFRFFWGYATYLYLVVPKKIKVNVSENSKQIIFLSFDPKILYSMVSSLVLMKKISIYRIVGLIKPTKFIRLKAGKQR